MSTERLAAIYTKWLRAGPLIEGFFVPYAAGA